MLIEVLRILFILCANILSIFLPKSVAHLLATYVLHLLGVIPDKVDGHSHLEDALKAKEPFIIAFNHPTFFEHYILYSNLRIPLRFIANPKNLKGAQALIQKFNIICVNGKTTDTILKAVPESFEKGFITIAPGAGSSFKDPTKLPKFRTGAFVAKVPILPVVLRYSPHDVWESGKPVSEVFWKRLQGKGMTYNLSILPLVHPEKSESPLQFAKRTRKIMKKGLVELPIPKPWSPSCNLSLWLTSLLFMIPAFLFYRVKSPIIALSVALTSYISLTYHGLNHPASRAVDLTLNLLHGILYGCYFAYSKYWLSIIMLIAAVLGYIFRLDHLKFVHLPIIGGWLGAIWQMRLT
jgi:hypothetical protein